MSICLRTDADIDHAKQIHFEHKSVHHLKKLNKNKKFVKELAKHCKQYDVFPASEALIERSPVCEAPVSGRVRSRSSVNSGRAHLFVCSQQIPDTRLAR